MIIDTNIIIRYLTKDDPIKAKRFADFLKEDKAFVLADVIVAEVYYVLESVYELDKKDILPKLRALIFYKNTVCNTGILSLTLTFLEKYNVGFADAYIVAKAMETNDGKVLSYDKIFDKINGVKRIEP